MNLEDLRALVAVAETGSLAKAAVRLHITQPAVTRRIQRLEGELGTKLLDREQRPARLTRPGEDAYRHALRMLQAAQDLRASAAEPALTEPVRFGVSYGVADSVLGLAVEAAQRATPGVRLALSADRSTALTKRVAAGDLHGAVICWTGVPPADATLVVTDLGREGVVVVAPAAYAGPTRTSLAAIAGQRWVINPQGCGFRTQLDRALVATGRKLDLAVEVWGSEMQISLIARGAGFGLIPARILAASPHRDLVRVLEVLDFRPELAVLLVAQSSLGPAAPTVKALGAAIAHEMQDRRAAA